MPTMPNPTSRTSTVAKDLLDVAWAVLAYADQGIGDINEIGTKALAVINKAKEETKP